EVSGIGCDLDGRGEADLLPAGGSFASEGCAGEQRAGARPQVADMGAGVTGALVEADAADVASLVGSELNAELVAGGIGSCGMGGRRRATPDRAGATGYCGCGEGVVGGRDDGVGAVLALDLEVVGGARTEARNRLGVAGEQRGVQGGAGAVHGGGAVEDLRGCGYAG